MTEFFLPAPPSKPFKRLDYFHAGFYPFDILFDWIGRFIPFAELML